MAAESGTAPENLGRLAYFARVQFSDLPGIARQLSDQFASVLQCAQNLARRSPIPADQITEQLIPVREAIGEAGQRHGPFDIPPSERSVLLTIMALPKELIPYVNPVIGEERESGDRQETSGRLASLGTAAPSPAPPPPDGWRTNAVGYWEPDPNHPDYPDKFKAWGRAVQEDDRNLGEDPRVTAVIEELNATLGPLQDRFLSFGAYSENLYFDHTYEQIALAITTATAQITAHAGNIAPPHVVQGYLVRRTIRPDVAHKLDIPWRHAAPVWLRFIPSLNEFVMRFSDATGNQRKDLTTLIERMQEHVGYLKPKRGRDPRKIKPVLRERAKTVAKLKHWLGLTHEEIAAFMEWDGLGATEVVEETMAQNVREYLRDGEDVLDEERGKNWATHPPDELAALLRWVLTHRRRRKTM